MVRFRTYDTKPDHDPNLPRHIWVMVEFGVLSLSNQTCPKFTQVDLGHGRICSRSDSGYPKLDLGCPKSKFRFGDVPNQIRNKVVFGLQQTYNKFYFKKFYLKKSMFKAKRKSKEFREVSVSIPKIICLKKVQVY